MSPINPPQEEDENSQTILFARVRATYRTKSQGFANVDLFFFFSFFTRAALFTQVELAAALFCFCPE